jgi:hypothetical protein
MLQQDVNAANQTAADRILAKAVKMAKDLPVGRPFYAMLSEIERPEGADQRDVHGILCLVAMNHGLAPGKYHTSWHFEFIKASETPS